MEWQVSAQPEYHRLLHLLALALPLGWTMLQHARLPALASPCQLKASVGAKAAEAPLAAEHAMSGLTRARLHLHPLRYVQFLPSAGLALTVPNPADSTAKPVVVC